jgi:hypothetical protein
MENTCCCHQECWRRLSVYLPDRNADPKVRKLEDSFIAYDLGKNYEGYETHLVVMEIKRRFSFSQI